MMFPTCLKLLTTFHSTYNEGVVFEFFQSTRQFPVNVLVELLMVLGNSYGKVNW